MAKARLRSRSTFSPVEQILEKAIENYKRDLRLARQQKQQQAEEEECGERRELKPNSNQANNQNHHENIYEMVPN